VSITNLGLFASAVQLFQSVLPKRLERGTPALLAVVCSAQRERRRAAVISANAGMSRRLVAGGKFVAAKWSAMDAPWHLARRRASGPGHLYL
jgi:hypothetical protein